MAPRELSSYLIVFLCALYGCAEGTSSSTADGAPPLTDSFLAADSMVNAADPVYVAVTGNDLASCGLEPQSPCASITRGIARATEFVPPRKVLVGTGEYNESVDMVDGVHLLGGFSPDFSQGPGAGQTIIKGATLGGESIAVRAENITEPTLLAGFIMEAAAASESGKSSYGLYIGDSPALTVTECTIVAKNGADGAQGTSGSKGVSGTVGENGHNGVGVLLPVWTCGAAKVGAAGYFGAGATAPLGSDGKACGEAGADGGRGEVFIALPLPCNGQNGKAAASTTGATASCSASTAGKGGQGGSTGEEDCDGGTSTPYTSGSPGCPGTAGTPGNGGPGGGTFGEILPSGFYGPATGAAGTAGQSAGGGGGGGGGGGNYYCDGIPFRYGGGGGGGGSGGCGGGGGAGGQGGGGSFGIFILNSYASTQITNCNIVTGNGGRGGSGGAGGQGGVGGAGGTGGVGAISGSGGDGGPGGAGGNGGGGGGGGGGPTIGIFIGKGTQPTTSSIKYKLGQPGGAGTGSVGNNGGAGISANLYLHQNP